MGEQFLRVADELGWGLDVQIEVLEEFIAGIGYGGRLDDLLRDRGLWSAVGARRVMQRDVMLDFIEQLAYPGVFSRFLQRKLAAAAAEAAASQPPVATPAEPRRPDRSPAVPVPAGHGRLGHRLFGWLRARQRARVGNPEAG